MPDNYRQASRNNWTSENISTDKIGVGALQRIADATEAMALNYTSLQRDRDYYKNRSEELQTRNNKKDNQISAYKGHINRLKKSIPTKAVRSVKVVCYCGSIRKASEAFKEAEINAVVNGVIALLPCCMFVDLERVFTADHEYKLKADILHKRKIDMADEVMILNVDGYIGESTRSEIEYAESIGKPVKYLQ